MEDDYVPTPAEIAAIETVIQSYGLMEIWQGVDKYLRQGYTSAADVLQMVSLDPDYQESFFKRFPAIKMIRDENAQRMSRGEPIIPEISAAEYVADEYAYSQATRGLPGKWTTRENITAWIAGDVAPTEVKARIDLAKQYIDYNVNPDVRAELRDIYGLTDEDMIDYVLSDPRRREVLDGEFQQRMKQATVGGAANSRGLGISDSLRDEIASSSDSVYTFGQAAAGFESVAAQADDYARLSAISGINTSRDDLIREEFNLAGGSSTTKVKKRLASQERGRFSGSSAIGANSLRVSGIGTQ